MLLKEGWIKLAYKQRYVVTALYLNLNICFRIIPIKRADV